MGIWARADERDDDYGWVGFTLLPHRSDLQAKQLGYPTAQENDPNLHSLKILTKQLLHFMQSLYEAFSLYF